MVTGILGREKRISNDHFVKFYFIRSGSTDNQSYFIQNISSLQTSATSYDVF